MRRGGARLAPALALAASGCASLQSALAPAGPQAARIASLWWLLLAVCALVLVAVIAVMVMAVGRAVTIGLPAAPRPVDPAEDRTALRWVVAATVVTVLVLGGLLWASVRTGAAVAALSAPDAPTVELVGHRWWWEVRYPDREPSRLAVSANEIHLPVGRPVRVRTISRDVIHSFWAPNLHGKRDLIPGYPGEIWIQADRPGHFPAQCAEFCGVQHAHMRLVVVAEAADRFDAWLARQREPAREPGDERARHGQQVFLAGACPACHTIRGTTAAGTPGPDLTHVGGRLTLGAGTLPNTAGHLGGWIVNPQGVKPGSLMPATSLPGEDLTALVSYLGSLR
jgi:cytochrome c oxidase subunit 2